MSADLQREDDDREADQHRDADGHHHDISVVEAGNHAHHVTSPASGYSETQENTRYNAWEEKLSLFYI